MNKFKNVINSFNQFHDVFLYILRNEKILFWYEIMFVILFCYIILLAAVLGTSLKKDNEADNLFETNLLEDYQKIRYLSVLFTFFIVLINIFYYVYQIGFVVLFYPLFFCIFFITCIKFLIKYKILTNKRLVLLENFYWYFIILFCISSFYYFL